MNLQTLTVAAVFAALTALSGCTSPPEPPEPSGERVAVNPVSRLTQSKPAAIFEAQPVPLQQPDAQAAFTSRLVDDSKDFNSQNGI